MKAVRVHDYGKPPSLDDVPEPTIEGPLDVLVHVDAAGVCRTDLHIIEGQWAGRAARAALHHRPRERRHGAAVGDAVGTVAVGDKVILHPLVTCGLCRACRAGDDVHCAAAEFPGLDADGGIAEFMRTGVRSVVKLARAWHRPTSPPWPTPASRPTTRCARQSPSCTPAPAP